MENDTYALVRWSGSYSLEVVNQKSSKIPTTDLIVGKSVSVYAPDEKGRFLARILGIGSAEDMLLLQSKTDVLDYRNDPRYEPEVPIPSEGSKKRTHKPKVMPGFVNVGKEDMFRKHCVDPSERYSTKSETKKRKLENRVANASLNQIKRNLLMDINNVPSLFDKNSSGNSGKDMEGSSNLSNENVSPSTSTLHQPQGYYHHPNQRNGQDYWKNNNMNMPYSSGLFPPWSFNTFPPINHSNNTYGNYFNAYYNPGQGVLNGTCVDTQYEPVQGKQNGEMSHVSDETEKSGGSKFDERRTSGISTSRDCRILDLDEYGQSHKPKEKEVPMPTGTSNIHAVRQTDATSDDQSIFQASSKDDKDQSHLQGNNLESPDREDSDKEEAEAELEDEEEEAGDCFGNLPKSPPNVESEDNFQGNDKDRSALKSEVYCMIYAGLAKDLSLDDLCDLLVEILKKCKRTEVIEGPDGKVRIRPDSVKWVPLVGKSGVEVSRTDKDMAIAMSGSNPEALVTNALDIIFGEKLAKLSALGERHGNGIGGTIYSTIYAFAHNNRNKQLYPKEFSSTEYNTLINNRCALWRRKLSRRNNPRKTSEPKNKEAAKAAAFKHKEKLKHLRETRREKAKQATNVSA